MPTKQNIHIFLMFQIETKMDAYNLAVVLNPNLMHSDNIGSPCISEMVSQMEWKVQVVEKLIIHVEEIFGK